MDERQKAAMEFLAEELSRELEFQQSDEYLGDDIVPLLREMQERIERNDIPTLAELEAWSLRVYDVTRGDAMYGDTDMADGLVEGLAAALELTEETA
jgi:hypothetical protein